MPEMFNEFGDECTVNGRGGWRCSRVRVRNRVRKSASVTHFRADGIMRSRIPRVAVVFSTVLQTQRDNWQHSSLSIWDAATANVFLVCPSTPQNTDTKPMLVSMVHCLLASSAGPVGQPSCPLPTSPFNLTSQSILRGRDRAQACSCAFTVKSANCC